MFPKSHSVPHAVLDNVGNELTDPQNIILAYRNEMFHRLQKRLIRANLKDYESAMNQLCRHRLHKARTNHSPDFSLSEVRNAISELKEGRCIDPTGFVREIFTRAGTGLVQSIVTMLNMIKKKWQVPSRWAEMYICTLYKQKGSWKELENHRGTFIVVIVSIIFEKVLKNRITPILRENMTKFQTGGIKGKGVVDNLFIMRALISHSLYVNQPLFLTFYDIEKCFDSLWLEDCINSLWENGVQNNNLYLIYLLNKKASITVKTPLCNASPFVIKKFGKQGTVLGPILNNCSLDRICKEGNGYQFGQANIKPLEFVDDLADPNHSSMSAHVSNSVIEQIQFEKRLKFSAKKCELLAIGSDDTGYTLDVNDRTIKHVSTVKYLGDILNAQGSNVDMIKSRVDRCHGSVTELISICKEAHFGQQQIEMMFLHIFAE